MKRMVTEEEIAEIASKNSKPLYRYNGRIVYYYSGVGYTFYFDIVSSKGMKPEGSGNADIMKAFLLAALADMSTWNASGLREDMAAVEITVDLNPSTGTASLIFSDATDEHKPESVTTIDTLAAFFAVDSFQIMELNLSTLERTYWEM